jgi:PAS domain S-box-containing protein
MSSQPYGSPAAPERSGRAWRLKSRSAAALAFAAALSAVAVALGIPSIGVLAFTLGCLLAAAALVHRQRTANLRLRSAKRALAASELAYRRFYDSLAVGVLTIGADGRTRTANPALLALLGYASERELAVLDFGEQVYAAPGTFEALLRRVRLDGELGAVDMQLRRRDGLPVMVAATVRAQWDESGSVEGYEAALLDIGELKFAERQRRSLERRFRRLFDSNAIGILFGNLRRGTMDEANARMRDIAGLRTSELPVLLDALVAEGQPQLSAAIRVALESDGHTPPLETVYLRADGTRVAVLVGAAVIDPLQGDFVGVVLERPAEPAAAARPPDADGLHGSVLDALPLLVARFNRSRRLTYCNAACREWFGFPATPTGLPLEDLLGVDGPEPLRAHIERVLAGEVVRAGVEVFQVGGRMRELEVMLSPHRRPDSTVGGFLTTMREQPGTSVPGTCMSPRSPADRPYNI